MAHQGTITPNMNRIQISLFASSHSYVCHIASVIFSYSGARSICSNPRNVPDDVLERVAEVGGVVMVNFYACFLIDNCGEEDATVLDVVKHINHIR